MKQISSLVRNAGLMTVGAMFTASFQILIGVVITKGFGVEKMGEYALSASVAVPVFFVFNLQLRVWFVSKNEIAGNVYSQIVFIRICCVLIAAAFVLMLSYMFGRAMSIFGLLPILFQSFNSLSDVIESKYHRESRYLPIFYLQIFRSIGVVLIGLGLYFVTRDLVVAIVGSFSVALISFFALAFSKILGDWKLCDRSFYLTMLRDCIFLVGGGLAFTIIQNYQRIYAAAKWDSIKIGELYCVTVLLGLSLIVYKILGQVFLPVLRDAKSNRTDKIITLCFIYGAVSLFVSVVGVLFVYLWGELILKYMYSIEDSRVFKGMFYYSISLIPLSLIWCFTYILNAAELYAKQSVAYVIGLVFLVFFMILYVGSEYSLHSLALSLFLTYTIIASFLLGVLIYGKKTK